MLGSLHCFAGACGSGFFVSWWLVSQIMEGKRVSSNLVVAGAKDHEDSSSGLHVKSSNSFYVGEGLKLKKFSGCVP